MKPVLFWTLIAFLVLIILISLSIPYINPSREVDERVYIVLTRFLMKHLKPAHYNTIPDVEPTIHSVPASESLPHLVGAKIQLPSHVPYDERNLTKQVVVKNMIEVRSILKMINEPSEYLPLEDMGSFYQKYFSWFHYLPNPPSFQRDLLEVKHVFTKGPFIQYLDYDSKTDTFKLDTRRFNAYDIKATSLPIGYDIELLADGGELRFKDPARDAEKLLPALTGMVTHIAMVRHLWFCHVCMGQSLAICVRKHLSKHNPLKAFLWEFIFGTLEVNYDLAISLLYPEYGFFYLIFPITQKGLTQMINEEQKSFHWDHDMLNPCENAAYAALKKKGVATPTEDDAYALKQVLKTAIDKVIAISHEAGFAKENQHFLEMLKKETGLRAERNVPLDEALLKACFAVSVLHKINGSFTFNYFTQIPSILHKNGMVSRDEYFLYLVLILDTSIPMRLLANLDTADNMSLDMLTPVYMEMVNKLKHMKEQSLMGIGNIDPLTIQSAVQA